MKKILLSIGLALVAASAYCQSAEQIRYIQENSDLKTLKRLGDSANAAYQASHAKALEAAKKYGWPIRTESKGKVVELVGLHEDGGAKYFTTNNLSSATSTSVNKLWAGSTPSYNLTGRGWITCIWDGGAVLTTHQEYSGRAIIKDGTTTYSDHSTHVGGTMIAKGVDPQAKGMAYDGNLWSYKWDNDVTEMTAAAANGRIVSNHSYGVPAGWDVDASGNYAWYGDPADQVDRAFGQYNAEAKSFDDIVTAAPYYLPFVAAGNSRGDGPATGSYTVVRTGQRSSVARPANSQYDQLSGKANSKNVMTVAAVNPISGGRGYLNGNDVVMTSFSSWGPTDDGRIKPDISAVGFDVYSCIAFLNNSTTTSNTAYTTEQGTSMATPNTTGASLLLQQMYSNSHNKRLMKASTLKAVLIHGADEAGSALGPDYKFGWGFLNAKTSADIIAQDSITSQIVEKRLARGKTDTFKIKAPGGKALKVTLAWTDPSHPAGANVLDSRVKMLVNDLDVRLIDSAGNVTLPWVLNVATPSAAATKADNSTDNVEGIFLKPAAAGSYIVTVSHKGTLLTGGGQNYSLVISGLGSPIAVNNATCRPKMFYESNGGTFNDGTPTGGTYSKNLDCQFLATIGDTSTLVKLTFTRFSVDAGDSVYVYQGSKLTNPLVGKYSGTTLPPVLSIPGGTALIRFVTDNSTNTGSGWQVNFSFSQPARLAITANNTTICGGQTVNYDIKNLNPNGDTVGTSFSWSFPGGTPATSTSRRPVVTYNTGGVYDVTLTATNVAGTNTFTNTGYITVLGAPFYTSPYYESFSNPNWPTSGNPDTAWTITSSAPTTENYSYTNIYTFSQPGSVMLRNSGGGTPPSGTKRALISPAINLGNHDSVWFSFQMGYTTATGSSGDKLVVSHSTDCGKTWTTLRTYPTGTTVKLQTTNQVHTDFPWFPDSTEFRLEKFLIRNGAANLKVKFEFTNGTGGNYLYLDDINFTAGGHLLAVSPNLAKNSLTLYPNPVTEGSVVAYNLQNGGQTSLTVTDMVGRVSTLNLGYQEAGLHNVAFDKLVPNAVPGIYLIKLQSGSQVISIKGSVR